MKDIPDPEEASGVSAIKSALLKLGVPEPALADIWKPQDVATVQALSRQLDTALASITTGKPEDDRIRRIEHLLGPLWQLTGNGLKLSDQSWGALYVIESTILFDTGDECFWAYQKGSGLWAKVTTPALIAALAERVMVYAREHKAELAQSFGSEKAPKDPTPYFALAKTNVRLKANIESMQSQCSENSPFGGELPPAIHVANGVVEIRNGEASLKPFGPDYRSRWQSPVRYEPEAECPAFLAFLRQALTWKGNEDNVADDIALIQKIMGQILLGRNRSQSAVILDGIGGTGKTTLAKLLVALIGEHNCGQLRTEHLGSRFETYKIHQKQLLIGTDVPADFLQRPGAVVLKSLVGGDPMDAERKGSSSSFTFAGDKNVVCTANTRLKVSVSGANDVSAWRRRLIILRFNGAKPETPIEDYHQKLLADEGPGILNFAIEGLIDLLTAESSSITLTKAQRARVDSLLDESRSVELFVRTRLEPTPGTDITADHLEGNYYRFCKDRSWIPEKGRNLGNLLRYEMLESHHVSRVNSIKTVNMEGYDVCARGYRNMSFKPEPGTEDQQDFTL